MYLVIAYDVSTDDKAGKRRLRKIAKACEGKAQRVQYSVFEANLTQSQWETLRADLLDIMEEKEDSLRVYRLIEPKDANIEAYGRQSVIDFDEPLIV